MSYGFFVSSPFGSGELTTQGIPRRIETVTRTGLSGTISITSGVTSTNGFVFTSNSTVDYTFSGTTITWSQVFGSSTTVTFTVVRVR